MELASFSLAQVSKEVEGSKRMEKKNFQKVQLGF